MLENVEVRFANWIIRRRWWLIIAMALFASLSIGGIPFITIDSDLRVFFDEGDPRLQELERLENTYTKNESIIIIVSPRNGDVFSQTTLTAITELTNASWQTPFSNRVDSISNFQYTHAQNDELVVEDLIASPHQLDTAALKQKRRQALSQPMLVNRLLAKDGHTTSVATNIIFSKKTDDNVMQVASFARQLVEEYRRRYPDIEFYLTGSIMFDTAFSEVSQHDMRVLVPLIFAILVIVVGVAVRSIIATIATMLVVLLSMLSALGLAGWLGISITPASANAPTIILTLAMADSVHILVTMTRLMYSGKSRHQALVESLTLNIQAVFLTSLTTVIGFLTMNFSDAPPFHDLGNIVAIGISMAFFYSVFLLPALMAVLPVSIQRTPVVASHRFFHGLSDFVIHYKTRIILVLGSVVILGGVMTTHNQLNDNWIKYFSENIPIRVATDIMEERLGGADYIEYSLPARNSGGIAEPEYLKNLEKFSNWLNQQAEVVHVYSILDIIKRLNKNLHNDNEAWYRIPDNRALAAQYLLLYELSLPLGLDLNHQINVDKSATRIIITTKDIGTRAFRDLDQRAQQWVQSNLPSHMHIRGNGLSIIWAYLSERNIVSMLFAAFLALVVISLVVIVAFRRLDIGLVSLVPNLTPAVLAFGLWALFVGEVGLGLSVVSSMTLGIVVDDTVHFITKYLRFSKDHARDKYEAVRQTFDLVGPAMTVTTIALVAGFLVLTFSDYKMSAEMGLLSAITVFIALVMDFLLLPALLLILPDKHKNH